MSAGQPSRYPKGGQPLASVIRYRPIRIERAAPASISRLYVIWALLIVALLPWRSGVYYSGGLDPTVAAKAALSVLALVLAIDAASRATQRAVLGMRGLLLILSYLIATLFGAVASGSMLASAILALRLCIIGATVALVFVAYPRASSLRTAVSTMAGIGLVIAITGLSSIGHARLTGGVLPAGPNQLALLFAPAAIWLVWRLVQREGARPAQVVALVALLGLTWLTGSRTGLVALVVAMLLMLIQHRRLPTGVVVTLIASMPFLFYVVFYTGVFARYLGRGGTGNVTTLNSRTIAWSAAFSSPHDFWSLWFGGGLSVKTVAVSGTYWNAQVLDSSWVSAFVQGGAVGLAIMGIFAISALVAAFRVRWPYRGLLPALLVYALIRSALENGLIDSYVLFVVALLPVLATEMRPAGQPSLWTGVATWRRRPTSPASSALSSASSRNSSTIAT